MLKYRIETGSQRLTQHRIDSAVIQFRKDMDSDRSSFFNLPKTSTWEKEWAAIEPKLRPILSQTKTFFHLGIGGSSLGAETIVRALQKKEKVKFHFLDNIDPDYLRMVLDSSNPETSLLYVISKSGNTMETLAQLMVIYEWMSQKLGEAKARERIVLCTDPTQGALRKLANDWKLPCFSIPPNLGGRFSALSAVGLFPAEVAGISSKELLRGAGDLKSHDSETDLAQTLVDLYERENRNVTVLMPYSQKLKPLAAWFTQLWAESLGKDGKGMTPLPAVGPTDQHSILQLLRDGPEDKVVGFLSVENVENSFQLKWPGPNLPPFENLAGISLEGLLHAELAATQQVLRNGKKPIFTISVEKLDAYHLGMLLYSLQTCTAIAGYCLDVNPFDQPGVEEGKVLTNEKIRQLRS